VIATNTNSPTTDTTGIWQPRVIITIDCIPTGTTFTLWERDDQWIGSNIDVPERRSLKTIIREEKAAEIREWWRWWLLQSVLLGEHDPTPIRRHQKLPGERRRVRTASSASSWRVRV
jgi:hypothetical protein